MQARPFFSLVVPTIERTLEVEALLSSLRDSKFRDFEVIIVDQNRDNRLDQIIYVFRHDYEILHLKVEFKGAARARNYGANYAKGQWINFPDDDCELKRDLLENARCYISELNVKVLIGVCIDRNGEFSNAKFKQDEVYVCLSNMWGRCIEATMFFDTATFLEVGGYDERFGVGSQYGGEEGPELLVRLISHLPNKNIFYSYKLQFYHPFHGIEFTLTDCLRSYNYSRGSGAHLAKSPHYYAYVHAANLVLRGIIAVIIYRKEKRKFYLSRLKGFFDGYNEFKRCENDRHRKLAN